MTDIHDPGDEVLSAYLSGELDDAEAGELDERLARDPSLAARLDGIAEVVTTLRGLDEVEPPPGFRERLDRRLADEQAPEVAALPARRARGPRWASVGVAAAALVAVTVAATGLLQGIGGFSADEAADTPLARTQGVPEAETFADDAAPEMAEEDLDEGAPAAGAPPGADGAEEEAEEPGPQEDAAGPEATAAPGHVRDEAVELPDEGAIRGRYRGLPEASAALGTPIGEADRLASAAVASLEAAGVNPGGVPATACVDAVRTTVGSPAVIVLVESAVTTRGAALAHVVVSAVDDRLDRVEALLLDPASCAPLERVVVSGGRE